MCRQRQHCWMLHVASICVPGWMLVRVVAQSLKAVKSFSPMQTYAALYLK